MSDLSLINNFRRQQEKAIFENIKSYSKQAGQLDKEGASAHDKFKFYEEIEGSLKQIDAFEQRLVQMGHDTDGTALKKFREFANTILPEITKLKDCLRKQSEDNNQQHLLHYQQQEKIIKGKLVHYLRSYFVRAHDKSHKTKSKTISTSISHFLHSSKGFYKQLVAAIALIILTSVSASMIEIEEKVENYSGKEATVAEAPLFTLDKHLDVMIGPELEDTTQISHMRLELAKAMDSAFVQRNSHKGYFTYGLIPKTDKPNRLRKISELALEAYTLNNYKSPKFNLGKVNGEPVVPPGYHLAKKFTKNTLITAYTPIGSGLQAGNKQYVEDGKTATGRNAFLTDGVAAAINKVVQDIKIKKGMIAYIEGIGYFILDDAGSAMIASAKNDVLHLDVRMLNQREAQLGTKHNLTVYLFTADWSVRRHFAKSKEKLF